MELNEGAKCLQAREKGTIMLRDFKNYAANVVKSLIGNDERFQEVGGKIGSTRSAIQQTELAQRLIAFVAESEVLLREGERLPMSTEILESSFGLYKQLERQHSKSGFTSLLACLPALLKPTTPERVKAAFARTSAKDVKEWVKKHFPSTVTSRRRAAYAEYRAALKRATVDAATA